jgi:hypothetical protein
LADEATPEIFMTRLEYFDLYTSIGLQVIPLYPNTKIPVGKNWNENWDKDWSRDQIERRHANMGLLLGEIVDVEGDTPAANEFLELLIGDIPHPVYRSKKSFHHLFHTPDPNLTGAKFEGIEFRGHRHQSVLPPSIGPDGTKYKWLRKATWPAPEMPPDLQDLYFKYRPQGAPPIKGKFNKKRGVKKGHTKTQCCVCKKWIYIHKKRLVLEVRAFREYGTNWHCQDCRELELRADVRRIRKQLLKSGEAVEMGLLSHEKATYYKSRHPW